MDELVNQLEARLSQLQPRPLPPELEGDIAARLVAAAPIRGDRLLWSAIVSGAAAACTILAMCVMQAAPSPSAASGAPAASVAQPTLNDYRQSLARADADWRVALK